MSDLAPGPLASLATPTTAAELLSWGHSGNLPMAPQSWQPLIVAIRSHNVTGVVTNAAIQQMLDAGFGAGAIPVASVVLSTAPPDPGFGAGSGAALTWDFQSMMADTGLPDLMIRWDFGDGTTGTGARIQHKYRKAGTYTVRSTVIVAGIASAYSAPVVVT